MHPCSESPSLRGPEDIDCLGLLTNTFSFIHRIGNKETVSASLVFKLSQDSQDIVVKVLPLKQESDLKDIKIACLLNGLSDETPVFVRTFGWIKCKEIPLLWLKGINMKKDAPRIFSTKSTYIFQVMSFSAYTWENAEISLDKEEYRSMLFLLLHGLWLARVRFNFKHNDIHKGQILFQTCKPNTSILVNIGENKFVLTCKRFVPKLIDFGFASIGKEEEEDDDFSSSDNDMFSRNEETQDSSDTDLHDLLYMFSERMKMNGLVPFKISGSLEDILTNNILFKSFKSNTGIKSYLCNVCSSVATKQWENHPIKFCDEKCALRWKEISKVL